MMVLPADIQNDISFSWALPGEIEEVWQLHQNCNPAWPHPKPFFEEALGYTRLLLARDKQTPIAYLVFQVLWGNTAFLSLVKVLPEYQRKGIGTTMMKLLEERLLILGFGSCLTSSELINQKTKRVLPSLGYAEIGTLHMQHGDEIFYLRSLS